MAKIQNTGALDAYVVEVSFWPGGQQERGVVVATALLTDQHNGSPDKRNFVCEFTQFNPDPFKKRPPNQLWKKAGVSNFRALRKNVWSLLYQALHRIHTGEIID
jgi:hypothetical protein